MTFLENNLEWQIIEDFKNCNGLMVIKKTINY